VWIGWSDALLERWDDALRHFDRAVQFATSAGRVLALPHLLVGQVFALYTKGRLAEAQAAAEHAVYLAQQSGSPEQLISAYSTLAWTDATMGRMDRGMESGMVAADQLHGTVGGFEALALRMLAEARLMTGDQEGCLALVDAIGGPNLLAADACFRIAWYELLTRAELALGRPEAAAGWAASAITAARLVEQPGRKALALLARAEALLAVDPEAALSSAEQAATGLAGAGMTVDALRARVALGVALWHNDRCDEAACELKDAQLALEQLGATTLVRLARTERRRLAARTSRARRADSTGTIGMLTDREGQIADLVREGLTNRLIAKRLHIAEKTVEMHLSKVFAKLGVTNRAALAVFATRNRTGAETA
jgi:DNA-binding CsgD family transcriptional regulator